MEISLTQQLIYWRRNFRRQKAEQEKAAVKLQSQLMKAEMYMDTLEQHQNLSFTL